MGRKLMIIGGGLLQLPAIEKALELGLSPVVADMDPNAPGFLPGVTKEVVSTIDIAGIVEAARRNRVEGVMTLATDMPMRSVAAVAKELGLVGISDETALKATDKAVMREALKEHGVPIPAFFPVKGKREFGEVISRFTSSFVVKPADSSGSRGIGLVRDPGDRREAEAAYERALSFSRSGYVVVEEYMRGPEVSVETLAVRGDVRVVQITDKITTGAPHFVEMGHTQPSRLPKETRERIVTAAVAANRAVGIEDGPSHTEIIVTEEGPKIVELGARLGGDCITTHLVPLSTGVDMVESCIRIALGEEPDREVKFTRGSAIRYFPQRAGMVRAIEGADDARSMKGVRRVEIVHGVGETVTDIDSSGSRMGFVIAEGSDADDAEANCEAALRKIRVTIG